MCTVKYFVSYFSFNNNLCHELVEFNYAPPDAVQVISEADSVSCRATIRPTTTQWWITDYDYFT